MSFTDKCKRLKQIVWDEFGIPKYWAVVSAFAPSAIQLANNKWPMEASKVEKMLDAIQWWWGIPIAALWIIWALSRKIFEYETPAVEEPTFFKHGDDWHMELRGKGKGKFHVVINFEIYKEDGSLFLPAVFGYYWNETHPNPIGIHGGGNQITPFVRHLNGMARIWGTDASTKGVPIDLPKGTYVVDMSIHAGGKMSKKVNVLNDGAAVYVS